MKLDHYLTLSIKIKSKWIKNLSVRSETIEFLEENTGSNRLYCLGYVSVDLAPNLRETKAKQTNTGFRETNRILHRERNRN